MRYTLTDGDAYLLLDLFSPHRQRRDNFRIFEVLRHPSDATGQAS
jgi:hypothetical protein